MKNPQGTATTLSEEDNSFIKVKVNLAQMTTILSMKFIINW